MGWEDCAGVGSLSFGNVSWVITGAMQGARSLMLTVVQVLRACCPLTLHKGWVELCQRVFNAGVQQVQPGGVIGWPPAILNPVIE